MSVKLVDRFEQRCRQLLKSHKKRAKKDGQQLDYGLDDIRALVGELPCCDYCGNPVDWTLQLDHRTPPTRDPRAHRLANLCVCCVRCNQMKGQLTAAEFLALLDFLEGLHPVAHQNVMCRLIAGGQLYARRKKGG